jgi:hypothetical protein
VSVLSTALDGGTIAFDSRLFGGDWGLEPLWANVTVSSGAMSATADIGLGGPSMIWQTYSGAFTANAFGVSEADWLGILSNVTEIKITVDDDGGAGEVAGYENIAIDGPPGVPALSGRLGLVLALVMLLGGVAATICASRASAGR